jgi:hypothetical protein
MSNDLHNSDSAIWKLALQRTCDVETKLHKTKKRCLTSNVIIGGTISEILEHLKEGPAKNLVNSFFRLKIDCCDVCKIKKSPQIQLDRAHCNKKNCDRTALLQKAIAEYYIDDISPIKIKLILIKFLELHKDIPLFMLCKKCHTEYDRK